MGNIRAGKASGNLKYEISELTDLLFSQLVKMTVADWQHWLGDHRATYTIAVRQLAAASTKIHRELGEFHDKVNTSTASKKQAKDKCDLEALQQTQTALEKIPHPSKLDHSAFQKALEKVCTEDARANFLAKFPSQVYSQIYARSPCR